MNPVRSGSRVVRPLGCHNIPNPTAFFARTHPSDLVVSPDDRYVYVLNRGHHSIAQFAVDPTTGRFEFMGTTSSAGIDPWTCQFTPNCEYFYVGNQGSGNVVGSRQKRAPET